MKQTDIIKVLANEFGSKDVADLNKILKAKEKEKIKFKIMGKVFGHIGLTVAIKAITPEGLKIFDVNRVRLIRFDDMESFEKAGPKSPRPGDKKSSVQDSAQKQNKKPTPPPSSKKTSLFADEDIEWEEGFDEDGLEDGWNDDLNSSDDEEEGEWIEEYEEEIKKPAPGRQKSKGKAGSAFIPANKNSNKKN